jgi:tRNA A-37 threonylcarbamoyl transferase component Bud32
MRICPRCQLKYPDDKDRCFVDGEPLAAMPDARVGTVLGGRYLIESAIGEGGMATVYRARHTLVDRPVAIKVMAPHLTKDASLRERFRREAKNSASLAHPHIIEILDTGETDDGTAFMVMELLDGSSLADRISEQGALPPPLVAELGLQIMRGLARAHDFQVIHRDLKPDNIFLHRGRDGRTVVKLLDFGIARSLHDSRLTSAGELFGTPQYMAPERVTSIDAGPLADLYAVGVIFYEMLTGELPFDADSLPGILIKHLQAEPPSIAAKVPGVPPALEALVKKLLAKKPADRPVDAHQVIKELLPLVPAGVATEAMQPTPAVGVLRQAARTLPPTTLERWARRAAVFEQMLARAYPGTAPPAELAQALAQLKHVITQINEARSAGLKDQRRLDVLETNAREARTRLGHAVDTLGVDLSSAREAARSARPEVQPHFDADRQAQDAYVAAHKHVIEAGWHAGVAAPSADIAAAFRAVAETMAQWQHTRATAEKAQRWIAAREQAVKDLEFQVEALRAQRQRVEETYEQEQDAIDATLVENGKQISALDDELMRLGERLAEPLRPRAELGPLFAELES